MPTKNTTDNLQKHDRQSTKTLTVSKTRALIAQLFKPQNNGSISRATFCGNHYTLKAAIRLPTKKCKTAQH